MYNEFMSQDKRDKGIMAANLTDARNNLKTPMKKTGQPNQVYDTKKEELKSKLEAKKREIRELERQNEDLRKKIEQQSRASNKLTIEHEKTILDFKEQSGTDVNKVLSDENERLQNEIRQLKIDCTEQKAEVDRLRLSLSKVAGERMVEGNPFISDLSDKNRPQKLTEKFNSLYDNSWTDAYEIIASNLKDEKDVCLKLLNMFQNCWKFCLDYSNKQLGDLQMSLLYPNITDDGKRKELLENYPTQNTKLIKDTRRCFAEKFIPALYQCYWDKTEEKDVEMSVQNYIEACLEFCWYSAITEPPLAYSFDAKENLNDFRGYTQSGDVIDHVVWPAMYLYEYGPLLYKGVVQFQNSKK